MYLSGLPLFWHPSPLGAIGFAFKEACLWEVTLRPWQACPSPASSPPQENQHFTRALDAYFAGNLAALSAFKTVPQRGTAFQREVWLALARLGQNQHTTYAHMAASIGRPKAVRAVGSAVGKNPLFLVLPCHRVLGTDGSLRGFACGLDIKRWLLAHEARFSAHSTLA